MGSQTHLVAGAYRGGQWGHQNAGIVAQPHFYGAETSHAHQSDVLVSSHPISQVGFISLPSSLLSLCFPVLRQPERPESNSRMTKAVAGVRGQGAS